MEIINNIYSKLKKLSKFIWNNIPNIIALIALFVSIKALNNANQQFKENSISSDSLFNMQFENTRKLNDSLIRQIQELQIITTKQLEITDEQLKVLTETLNEEKYSGRPKFQIGKTSIEDTIVNSEIFSPALITQYKNIGRRFAYKTIFKAFIVYPDFSGLRSSLLNKNSMTLETNALILNRFKPKIPLQFKDNFYYCFVVEYYDNELNRTFKQTEFYHYFLSRGRYEFNSCSDNEKLKVWQIINKTLTELNEKQIGL